MDNQRTYTEGQAPDRRKFRRDQFHGRIPVSRNDMDSQRTYNVERGPHLAEAGTVFEENWIPTGAEASKKGRKSRQNFDRRNPMPRKEMGSCAGHQVEEEEEL